MDELGSLWCVTMNDELLFGYWISLYMSCCTMSCQLFIVIIIMALGRMIGTTSYHCTTHVRTLAAHRTRMIELKFY